MSDKFGPDIFLKVFICPYQLFYVCIRVLIAIDCYPKDQELMPYGKKKNNTKTYFLDALIILWTHYVFTDYVSRTDEFPNM